MTTTDNKKHVRWPHHLLVFQSLLRLKFAALHFVFKVIKLNSDTMVITLKTQHNAVNVNSMWKLGFKLQVRLASARVWAFPIKYIFHAIFPSLYINLHP